MILIEVRRAEQSVSDRLRVGSSPARPRCHRGRPEPVPSIAIPVWTPPWRPPVPAVFGVALVSRNA